MPYYPDMQLLDRYLCLSQGTQVQVKPRNTSEEIPSIIATKVNKITNFVLGLRKLSPKQQ